MIYGNLLVVIVAAPWGFAALSHAGPQDWFSVIYLGVVQLGISYTLFTYGMAHGVRSLDAGIICYIEPVLNPLWVALIVGELPSGATLVGGLCIVGSLAFRYLRSSLNPQTV